MFTDLRFLSRHHSRPGTRECRPADVSCMTGATSDVCALVGHAGVTFRQGSSAKHLLHPPNLRATYAESMPATQTAAWVHGIERPSYGCL